MSTRDNAIRIFWCSEIKSIVKCKAPIQCLLKCSKYKAIKIKQIIYGDKL
jgi:hypothetical protein